MGLGTQYSLDLDDSKQYILGIINKIKKDLFTNERIYIRNFKGEFFIMTRIHDLGGTDYFNHLRITYEEARWLYDEKILPEFMGAVSTYERNKND